MATTFVDRRRSLLSLETHLALAPATTYASLLTERRGALWQRLGTILLVIAVAIPIMAVQRVTIGLVVATAICWSFILIIQFFIGVLLITSVRSRQIRLTRALDLWFAGHLPYSVWLMASAAVMANLSSGSTEIVIALAVVPSVWTSVIVSAFCRVVLNTSRAGARIRATIHFIVVWAVGLQYVALASGGWFQITSSVTRFFE
jgi:hypothetical protein